MFAAKNKKDTKIRTAILIVIAVLLAGIVITEILIYRNIDKYKYQFYGEMTEDLQDSKLYSDMRSGKSFCFLGDSITIGAVTGLVPWYHHIELEITGEVSNFSNNGWSSKTLKERADEIPVADVYVVAIGINDVVFVKEDKGALTPEEYVENLQAMTDNIRSRSPEAEFYFVAPWPFLKQPEDIEELRDDFAAELDKWCDEQGMEFIDPEGPIEAAFDEDSPKTYMADYLHPNAKKGIGLYSYAVLKEAE